MLRCDTLWRVPLTNCHSSRGDALEIQQEAKFNEIATDVQNLIARIAQGFTKTDDLVRTEHGVTRDIIVGETAKAQEAVNSHLRTKVTGLDTHLVSPQAINR